MITIRNRVWLLLSLMFLVILFNCTELPFGENKISSGHRQISGMVELHDGGSPEGVYVWLSGFDIGAYTDESGNFKLTLPPKSGQGSAGGSSGTFDLYFYLANYLISSSPVVVRDGEFVYSSGDINSKGKLYLPKVMRRFLRINTSVNPSSVALNYTNPIEVKVTLEATIDSATVIIPGSVDGMLGAVLVKKIDSHEVFIYEAVPGSSTRAKIMVPLLSTSLSMTFNLVMKPLQPGKYEVIPYLLMAHETIPAGLIESIGQDVKKLNSNYLKIPFRREGGGFEVK